MSIMEFTTERVWDELGTAPRLSALCHVPSDLKAPAPAVLLAGSQLHSVQTKAKFERVCHKLVANGFIVLEIDASEAMEGQLVPPFIWNTNRAVDYLVSRLDVDANRIGLACDGGIQTGLLMIREPRLAVTVPFNLVSMMKTMLLAAGERNFEPREGRKL